MSGGRELGHVTARFGDEDLGGTTRDARDRAQQLDLPIAERAQLLLDRFREPVDRLVEEVDVGEYLPDNQRVLGAEAPLQCFTQRRQLLAQLATREFRQ